MVVTLKFTEGVYFTDSKLITTECSQYYLSLIHGLRVARLYEYYTVELPQLTTQQAEAFHAFLSTEEISIAIS